MSLTITVISSVFAIIGVHLISDDVLKLDYFNIYKYSAIETRELQNRPVTVENVTYYLFTADNPDEYIKLKGDNLNLLSHKKIVFIIHGWTSNRESDWYEDLKDAFLTTYEDYYVVQVDWKEPANQLYYVSSINTYDVANIIANLIVDLVKNHNVHLDDVLLIGHSLGGQITGFVGKYIYMLTGRKLPRIIALDPAGPLFSKRPEGERLNKHDAEVVEVIHSDGTFGFEDPTGTIDFFPNGGTSQPGCKIIDVFNIKEIAKPIFCDHHRACEYFIEAILNPGEFVAKKCADWESYKENICEDEEVAMGDLTTNATGNFFLETNRDRPFSKTKKIIKDSIKKFLNVL